MLWGFRGPPPSCRARWGVLGTPRSFLVHKQPEPVLSLEILLENSTYLTTTLRSPQEPQGHSGGLDTALELQPCPPAPGLAELWATAACQAARRWWPSGPGVWGSAAQPPMIAGDSKRAEWICIHLHLICMTHSLSKLGLPFPGPWSWLGFLAQCWVRRIAAGPLLAWAAGCRALPPTAGPSASCRTSLLAAGGDSVCAVTGLALTAI